MNKLLFAIAAIPAMLGLSAAPAPAQVVPARPKLAIVIHAEGLTSALFQQRRTAFTGGLGRLARGTVFINAAPGDASADPLAARLGDAAVKVAVGGSQSPSSSGFDQVWNWDGQRFSGAPGQNQSRIVPVGNEAIARLIARAEPALTVPPACAGSTPSSHLARAAGDSAAFASSPALDAATLAIGAGLVGELRMGTDSQTDLLLLRLPATGRVAAAHGAGSEAACLQLLSLDRDLAGFFSQLDRGGIDYVVGLAGSATAGETVPLIFWRAGMDPAQVAVQVSTSDLAPTMAAWLGTPTPAEVSNGRCLAPVQGVSCPR